MIQIEENIVQKIVDYYLDNNKEIPKTVTEYIQDFPPGLSRQAVKKRFGLNCLDFLKLINPSIKPKKSTVEVLYDNLNRLNYSLVDKLNENLYRSKDRISVSCNDCKFINETTLDSLRGSLLGCPKCKSGNLSWSHRLVELDAILLDKFECNRISEVPKNHHGYLKVRHNICGTEYTSQLTGFVLPNTPRRGSCPNCRSTDTRVSYCGITFGSTFELECYKLLAKNNPELHVSYKEHFTTDRRWVCDFKIGNYWIEVSNFKLDFKNYFSNIEEKRNLVEDNDNYFFFLTSLKEVEEISSLL